MFLYGADERADFFRLLVLSEELFLQQTGGDRLSLSLQFIKDLVELDFRVFNIGVQVARFAAFPTGTFLRLIP